MGRTPLDYLLLPVRVILSGGTGYERFYGELGSFWIVLIPLALIGTWRSVLVRRCLAVAGLHFALWSVSSQQMRLLIPVLPLLAMASAASVVGLVERIDPRRWRVFARGAALAAAALLLVAVNGRYFRMGYLALDSYQSQGATLREAVIHPVFRVIGDELPPDARLLFLNTNRGFFCERDYIADSFFEASQIADWLAPASDVAALRERLAQRGITHILAASRDWGIRYPASLGELLSDPGQVELVYRSRGGRLALFALR
jgi:hypothetical protein